MKCATSWPCTIDSTGVATPISGSTVARKPIWRELTELVELYRHAGPSLLCEAVLPGAFLFGYDGFMALLVGQRVETQFETELTADGFAALGCSPSGRASGD